jgi:hypothetical protein
MKYLKRFNEVNENNVNEGLKNMFLVPLMVTMGYINAQNVTDEKVEEVLHKKAKNIVFDKTELQSKDIETIVDEKAHLVYDFLKSAGSDVRKEDFENFCDINNIDKNFFDKFLYTTKGSFITNINSFGNIFQANLNLTKNISVFASKDPFNRNLGVKINF